MIRIKVGDNFSVDGGSPRGEEWEPLVITFNEDEPNAVEVTIDKQEDADTLQASIRMRI